MPRYAIPARHVQWTVSDRASQCRVVPVFSGAYVPESFVLSDDERDQLVGWSRGSSRLAVRARIVLACAQPGVVYERVAAELGVTAVTVGTLRKRFGQARLGGLADEPRPGRQKAELVLTDDERDQLIRWSR